MSIERLLTACEAAYQEGHREVFHVEHYTVKCIIDLRDGSSIRRECPLWARSSDQARELAMRAVKSFYGSRLAQIIIEEVVNDV